jgi:small subunit ribosomal protein S5
MGKKNQSRPSSHEKEAKEFDEEVLQIDRVTRVVKGGRRMRFRCLVAIGDRKGRVGIGIGKATEVVNGIKKAISKAKKSLIKVPITDTDSIPHFIEAKYKAAKLMIMPASPGTGLIAGGALRKILRLSGVKNVLSKSHGSNNKVVTAQATILALKKLRPVRQSSKKSDASSVKPAADTNKTDDQKKEFHKKPVADKKETKKSDKE